MNLWTKRSRTATPCLTGTASASIRTVLSDQAALATLGLFLIAAAVAQPMSAEMPDKTVASRTAEIDGVKFHYLTAGQGPALILLHGYTQTSRMWRPITPLVADRFSVIATGRLGLGGSLHRVS
jgi:hypothetical protein